MIKKIFSVLTAVVISCGAAQATIIPDGDLTGIESTINITSGLTVSKLVITLNISGGRNGDLYAYLTHDGVTAILLNRVGRGEVAGGYNDSGFSVTFQDGADSTDIHINTAEGGSLSGTFEADGRNVSPFSVTTSSTRNANPFSAFNGQSGNGNWTLFIADVNGNNMESTLDSWSITEIPEATNVALGVFGGSFAILQGVRFWKNKKRA